MKIFPFSLLRIAGKPYNGLENMGFENNINKKYFRYKTKLYITKSNIDKKLYNLIGSLENRDKQNFLLNFKRDIYNERNISDKTLAQVYKLINKELRNLIDSYFSLLKEISRIKKEGEEVFAKELVKSRKEFKKLLNDSILKRGVLLSSKDLFHRLKEYESKEEINLNRNDLKVEQSTLKYLTRIRTKTSPFSTFTHLSITKHSDNKDNYPFKVDEEKIEINSYVRLNNYLFYYLKALIFENEGIFLNLPLRLNPTIRKSKEELSYLTNYNNIESFQRIKTNAFLELLIDKLSGNKRGIIYSELINLLKKYTEASSKELQNYINELIKYGFIEFNLGISGKDPEWDIKLCSKLKELEKKKVPLVNELRLSLISLRKLAKKFEKAKADERYRILMMAYNEFKGIAFKLHKAAGLPEVERIDPEERGKQQIKNEKGNSKSEIKKDESEENTAFKHERSTYFNCKPKNLFYEDTKIDTSTFIEQEELKGFVAKLDQLLESLAPLTHNQFEKDRMLHFFKKRYRENDTIDLLTFYEDYYRDFKKTDSKLNNDNIKSIKIKRDITNEWTVLFKKYIDDNINISSNCDTINLKYKHINEVNDKLGVNSTDINRKSLGAFIQFYKNINLETTASIKGVVNGTFDGFGRLLSRFLHIFDKNIEEELYGWNQQLSEGQILVENTDASYFNGNLHPPLVKNEVWLPGGQNSVTEEDQIPITNLAIKLDNNSLKLIHKKDKVKVNVLDLGFQGKQGRSQLYQMLSNFGLPGNSAYKPILGVVNKWVTENKTQSDSKSDKVIEFPRIEYEDSIVLQRKKWKIPKSKLPGRNSDESDWLYFIKINEWRMKNNIPQKIFVRIVPRKVKKDINEKKMRKLAKNDYKPQYIDFNNPLLVSLFETLVRKVPFSMVAEEMLPSKDQLFEINDNSYVTELLIQWYKFN